MTREEANWYIDSLKLTIKQNCLDEKYIEAIEALKAEPCEDAVSRETVLDAFWKLDVELRPSAIDAIINMVNSLPPVPPKQRTGKWIRHTRVENVYDIAGVKTWGIKHQCDQCTFTTIAIEGFGYYDYCPHCGAKMEGVSE